MGEILEGIVLKQGDLDCYHERIFYIDNDFDGQAWWCDLPKCGRHEKIPYSPGDKIKFPAHALISTDNPKYGGEIFYAFRTNENGEAKLLPRDQWLGRERRTY